MTITYRGDGAWGTGKGSALNEAEFDNNTYDHDTRITAIEDNPPVAIGISNITQSGTQFVVWLGNGDSFGPFELPIFTPTFRGKWLATTAYFEGDIVSVSGQGLYYVLQDHTSAATFDPDATNSAGDLYKLIYADPGNAPVVTVATSTYTPSRASSSGKYHRCTSSGDSSGDVIISIMSGIFAVGDEMHFRQAAAGVVTIVEGDTGVVLNGVTGFLNQTFGQGAVLTVKCVAVDVFDIFGMLAEDVSA